MAKTIKNLTLGGTTISGQVEISSDGCFTIALDDREAHLKGRLLTMPDGRKGVRFDDGTCLPVAWSSTSETHSLCVAGQQYTVGRPQSSRRGGGTSAGGGSGNTVEATMPGNVLQVLVNVGDTVTAGQTVVIMESMKMELSLSAPCDGEVKTVNVSDGDKVEQGATFIQLTPAEEA